MDTGRYVGALVLIIGSTSAGGEGNTAGDLLVICAQLSFTCYLVFFKRLIARYSPVTLMKWLFTYSSICVIPFTYDDLSAIDWSAAPPIVTWGCGGICNRTHLSQLPASACRAEEPAPHRDSDVQLRATCSRDSCSGLGRSRPIHCDQCPGRHNDIFRSVSCDAKQGTLCMSSLIPQDLRHRPTPQADRQETLSVCR